MNQTAPSQNIHTQPEHPTKKSPLRWIVPVLLAAIFGAGAAAGFYFMENMDKFGKNVVINAVSVAEMTPDEAVVAVSEAVEQQLQTQWTFQYEGENVSAAAGDLIKKPEDVGALVDDIWQQMNDAPLWRRALNILLSEPQNYPLAVEYDAQALEQMAALWHEKWDQVPVNAALTIDASGFHVTPSQEGRTVQEQTVFDKFPENYEDIQPLTLEVAVAVEPAAVNEDQWANVGELASFITYYNPGEINRTHNMSLAAAKINGVILYPGDEFSFNNTVGMRTASAGYREAAIISNGAYKPELGGGICQVTSTLYNGALLSGLEIVERHNHGLDVAYITSGRDATVYYGVQDFRFRNSNQFPIYLGMSVSGGIVSIVVYGNLDEKQNISITTILDQVIPFGVEYEEDPSLTAEKVTQSGVNGKVVRAFRNYLDEAGNIVTQEALGTSRYQPLTKIISRPPEVPVADPSEPVVNLDHYIVNNFGELVPIQPSPADSSGQQTGFNPEIDPFGNVIP